jgi:hypothetical protein
MYSSHKLSDYALNVLYVIGKLQTISKFLDLLPVNDPAIDIVVDLIDNFLKERNESVFMTVTADELVFKGWPMDTYVEL